MKLKKTEITLKDYNDLLAKKEKLEKDQRLLNNRIDLIVEVLIKLKYEI